MSTISSAPARVHPGSPEAEFEAAEARYAAQQCTEEEAAAIVAAGNHYAETGEPLDVLEFTPETWEAYFDQCAAEEAAKPRDYRGWFADLSTETILFSLKLAHADEPDMGFRNERERTAFISEAYIEIGRRAVGKGVA